MDILLSQRICHLAVFLIFSFNWPTVSKTFVLSPWQLNFSRKGNGINASGQAPQWPLHLDHSQSFMQTFVRTFFILTLWRKCNTLVTKMLGKSLGFKKRCLRCLNLDATSASHSWRMWCHFKCLLACIVPMTISPSLIDVLFKWQQQSAALLLFLAGFCSAWVIPRLCVGGF